MAAVALVHRRAWLAAALVGAAGAAGALGWQQWRALAPGAGAAGLPEDDVCLVAPATPYDPASGLDLAAARPLPAGARCPVCGMFPERAPEWAAQLIFEGGDAHFFDSPLSLFMYLQEPRRYSPGRAPQAIAAHYVTDAGAGPGTWLDARNAWYVHGSSARGPMRAGNLPAFATREAAQAFAQRRGGRVLGYGEVGGELIASLAGSGGHGVH
ncbi:nitrous oxide reductase accessory protein NosL [Pulveribacter sp.]|uniref:nitrous oxide reductase accessory protein NosL n=1 Tax=Pulveribacter sp. TaxID=2678893 RepID=UPI00289F74BE|nr:nitrous oxide reductase accessory protein NosL [Pulveribacter sp.]